MTGTAFNVRVRHLESAPSLLEGALRLDEGQEVAAGEAVTIECREDWPVADVFRRLISNPGRVEATGVYAPPYGGFGGVLRVSGLRLLGDEPPVQVPAPVRRNRRRRR
jgi:hypothetical protein